MSQMALPFDSGDKSQVKAQIKATVHRDAVLRTDLHAIMGSESGRRWIANLLELCHPYQTPFSRDPIAMAFNCGEQNIGLQLIADLHKVSPDLYLIMMKENSNERRDSSPGTDNDRADRNAVGDDDSASD